MTEVPIIKEPTTPMICRANQWTGFYMTGTSVKKEFTRVMCSQSYVKFCVRSNIVIFLFIYKFFFFT